jgi:vitamin B12 transporter
MRKVFPMPKRSTLALAIALAPSIAFAAETPLDEQLKLSTIVVTSSRQPQLQQDAVAATEVFTREDIERLQPASVAELLNRVPGVQITQSGGRGSLTGLYIRGTKSSQSLVLIDGVRINGADSGSAALEALAVDQIERIEVLRGARSAIYGADAIGGVVQIFTRRGEGDGLRARVHLGYGTEQTWERSLGLSGGNADTRFNLSISNDETNGINRTQETTGPDSDRDAYRNTAVSFNFNHRFSDRFDAGVSLLDQRGESEFDLSWDGDYPYNDFQLSTASVYANLQVSELWHSRLELGHAENRSWTRFDDHAGSDAFNTYRDSLAWLNTLQLTPAQQLLVGFDGHKERLNGNDSFAQTSRWNRAAFVQHRYDHAHFSTEVGLRHDDNELYGSENTLSAALTWRVNQDNDLIVSYGEGFRAPTFVDLYYPGYDNPALQPETSKSYELQWRSRLGHSTELQASIYRTDIDNAITLDSSWTPQNIGTARINGFEARLQHELLGWQTALALELVDPVDRDTDKTLARRAKRSLSLDLDRTFKDLSVGGSWQLADSRWDDAANTREIAGYGLVNLRSRWQLNPELALRLKVDNLFDKEYATALYDVGWPSTYHPYRETGRTALLSLTWTPVI